MKISFLAIIIEMSVVFLSFAQENQLFQVKNLTRKDAIHYATEQDTLMVHSTTLSQVFLVKFAAYFEAAAPPMNTESVVKASVLNVQKVTLLPTNQPVQLEEGLYLFQKDTTTSEGIGLKVTKKDFPKYKKITHLINAMIYITTSSEMASLLASDDKRLVFDNFWLTIGGNLENARRLLKLYFQRVREANHRFTSYKEGWKMDMGLIYIIFGNPDNIIEQENKIKWEYFSSSSRPKAAFDFVRRPNIFTGYHYELVRSPLHKEVWYEAVKKWRGGEVH